MGIPKKSRKVPKAATKAAVQTSPEPAASLARKNGRRLTLKFNGPEVPILERIAFTPKVGDAPNAWDQNDSQKKFAWSEVPKALSLFFLKYVAWDKAGRKDVFYFQGQHKCSLAASLGDAINGSGPIQELFEETVLSGRSQSRTKLVFQGQNVHGRDKDKKDRRITVSQNYLPPDCVEIFWDVRGDSPLSRLADLKLLENRIRASAGIPEEAPATIGEGSCEENAKPVKKPEKADDVLLPNFKLTKPKSATEVFSPKPKDASIPPAPTTPPESQPARPQKQEEPPPPILNIPAKRIDPHLFEVPPSDGRWPDGMPLMRFDSEEETFEWTLQNAFEGVLIMGATGSGKTSGSGTMLAESFLDAGFGGLVLTVKDGETQHWRELCQRCGRGDDLVVVGKKGDWKLNVLAYEAQRPGGGGGLADNMVAFCRNLLKISTRNRKDPSGDGIWQIAGDQLLNATFDLFILAGIEITFDRLHDFIAKVPAGNAGDVMAWRKIQLCSSVLLLAEKNAKSGEDLRLLERAKNYWFTVYPALPGKTRAGVTLGIFAMLDAFRGRDVPAVISSDTNITPEGIMSGKIVVLDLPIKEHEQAGLLVQSAWKYLFQKAIERQSKAGRRNCRPVFLWEDEGQYFFSDHDHHFQDTARSARVSRVILSQNLHSFYKEFGREGEAAANNVFGNLNTKIFHYNDDPATNQWASRIFGSVLVRRTTISSQPSPEPKGIWESYVQAFDPPKNTGYSSREEWEPAMQPNEFLSLRNGGPQNDFLVDAYISWQGLSGASGSPFIKTTFNQKQTEK